MSEKRQPVDYVRSEERVPHKGADGWLLVLWAFSGGLCGWVAAMVYYGVNLL